LNVIVATIRACNLGVRGSNPRGGFLDLLIGITARDCPDEAQGFFVDYFGSEPALRAKRMKILVRSFIIV